MRFYKKLEVLLDMFLIHSAQLVSLAIDSLTLTIIFKD